MIAAAAILAAALPVAASPAPEQVALTVYRAPGGGSRRSMTLSSLDGFALITETRTIYLPAGEAVVRFEGVAEGIVPASAIVSGLPGGTIEKNRDARLLSPFSLIDGTLGRRVTIRRTNRQTGAVREQSATIVAVPTAAGGGVVMRTADGIETLRCPYTPEKAVFDGVPPGLSAKPVLSVTTRSDRARSVRVTLSYLASGFDWSASYVATVAPAGDRIDLFAWATIANANAQGFADAQVQVVAGRLQRASTREIMARAAALELRCFPLDSTTSNLPISSPDRIVADDMNEIIVTGMRAQMASAIAPPAPPPPPPPPPEDLGDLKLYRVPRAVTVAPNAQKQVALIAQSKVAYTTMYRVQLWPWRAESIDDARIVLRMKNEESEGLGIPLPAGTTAVYQHRDGRRLLIGLGTIGDKAKGEKVRIAAGTSPQVTVRQSGSGRRRHVVATNANPFPVALEIPIGQAGDRPYLASVPLPRIEGVQTWTLTLSANSEAVLDYNLPN